MVTENSDAENLPMPGWKFAVATTALLAIAFPLPSAIYQASLHADTDGSIAYISAFVVGTNTRFIIPAVLVAIVCFGLSKLRLNDPGKWPLRIGAIAYWLGALLGLSLIAVAITFAVVESTDEVTRVALRSDAIRMVVAAFACWFGGRGIRYMLGR